MKASGLSDKKRNSFKLELRFSTKCRRTPRFSPPTPVFVFSNVRRLSRPPLCARDGRRGPVGGLKPGAIASDNEDGLGGSLEKATTLPTQVAAHFSSFASQPATGDDFGGLGFVLNATRHPTGTPRELKRRRFADRRRRRLSERWVATARRTTIAPHQAPSAARWRG